MSRELPEWQAYDPASSPLPDIRGSSAAGKGGAVVVLLATPGGRENGWSAEAAKGLAAGWAAKGRRIFLADLALDHPLLHRTLGVDNGEGVSDAFLYGASVRRIAVPVEDGRFFFAPAGTAVADPEAVAGSARWDAVLDGFRTARADVLLFLPSEQPGAARLLDRATDVVVLARGGELDGDPTGGLSDRVRAVLGPPAQAHAASPPPSDDAALAAPDPVPAVAGAEPGPPGRRERMSVPPLPGARREGPVPAATSRGRVASEASEGRRPRSRTGTLLVLLLVVLVAVAVAWWYGLVELPGLASPATAEASPGPVPAAATPAVPAPVLGGSLAVESFRDGALARLQRDALAERRPDLLFVLAPVEVGGEVFHRLVVGPARDSADAEGLRAELATTLPSEDPEGWLPRATGVAWAVGEAADPEAAEARLDALRALDIPAYVLEVPGAPDAPRHRVWAGAYADSAEAAWMGRTLAERGITDAVLTERVGRLPGATP